MDIYVNLVPLSQFWPQTSPNQDPRNTTVNVSAATLLAKNCKGQSGRRHYTLGL